MGRLGGSLGWVGQGGSHRVGRPGRVAQGGSARAGRPGWVAQGGGWRPTQEHPDTQTNRQRNPKPGPPKPNAPRSKTRHSEHPRSDYIHLFYASTWFNMLRATAINLAYNETIMSHAVVVFWHGNIHHTLGLGVLGEFGNSPQQPRALP